VAAANDIRWIIWAATAERYLVIYAEILDLSSAFLCSAVEAFAGGFDGPNVSDSYSSRNSERSSPAVSVTNPVVILAKLLWMKLFVLAHECATIVRVFVWHWDIVR